MVDNLSILVELENKELVVAGDFNAKATEWGSSVDHRKGQILVESCASRGLTTANTEGKPTFARGESKSYIDITFVSENIMKRLKYWEVLHNEPLTLHKHIFFEINDKQRKKNPIEGRVYFNKNTCWRTLEEDLRNNYARDLEPMEAIEVVRRAYKKIKRPRTKSKQCPLLVEGIDR